MTSPDAQTPAGPGRSHGRENPHDGDEAVMRALFESTYDDLLRFVERRTHPANAEDVVAEVFLTTWRRLDDVPADHGDARAWLFTVARNTLANRQRGDRRQEAVAIRLARQPTHRPESEVDGAPGRLDLAAAFARLGERDQEVLALVVWDALTQAQAARVLGISPSAFSVRLVRARRRLRRLLQGAASGASPSELVRVATFFHATPSRAAETDGVPS